MLFKILPAIFILFYRNAISGLSLNKPVHNSMDLFCQWKDQWNIQDFAFFFFEQESNMLDLQLQAAG